MSRFLPLFPLGLVVFPGENFNLHIFEPRYRQLLNECEQDRITFGIPPFIDKKMSDIGTEIRLVRIAKRYEDGRMDIQTQGIGIFKIEEFHRTVPDKLYAGADISDIEFDTDTDIMLSVKILNKVKELYELLNIKKSIPDNPATFSTYSLAHHVGFSVDQELDFLHTPQEKNRQALMLAHLDHLVPMVRQTELLRKRVRLNGHFKDIIPPDFSEGDFSI